MRNRTIKGRKKEKTIGFPSVEDDHAAQGGFPEINCADGVKKTGREKGATLHVERLNWQKKSVSGKR